jgi:hypothetical protein
VRGDGEVAGRELQRVPAAAADVTRPGHASDARQRRHQHRDHIAMRGGDNPAARVRVHHDRDCAQHPAGRPGPAERVHHELGYLVYPRRRLAKVIRLVQLGQVLHRQSDGRCQRADGLPAARGRARVDAVEVAADRRHERLRLPYTEFGQRADVVAADPAAARDRCAVRDQFDGELLGGGQSHGTFLRDDGSRLSCPTLIRRLPAGATSIGIPVAIAENPVPVGPLSLLAASPRPGSAPAAEPAVPGRLAARGPAWGKSPSGRRPLARSRPGGRMPSVISRWHERRKEFG